MRLPGLIAGIAIAISSAIGAQQRPLTAHEDPGVDLLLLDVVYDHLRLESALAALQDGQGHRFLPLRQLSNALGFRLHVDSVTRVATGFLGDPKDRINLNGAKGVCWRKATNIRFETALCFAKDNDLYIESGLLGKLAGLHFDWQLNRLLLNVSSDTPLPIQQQWMQRRMMERIGLTGHQHQDLPILRTPYALWSQPSLDLQWYTDASMQDKAYQGASRLQAEGHGDLLFLSARYRFISGSGGQPPATLVTLGRDDPHAGLLGPLRATQFSFGDLSMSQIPLFARTRNGLGLTISNFPVAGGFVDTTPQIVGNAPQGSTVEVYRGSELLGTVHTNGDGRYTFSSLPLESGPNELRIVVISPEGDVREEGRTLYGDASGPAAGKTQYRLTAGKVGGSIVPHGLSSLPDEQRRREAIAEFQIGLATGSWLAATVADTESADGEKRYFGVGWHSWEGANLLHVQTMGSDNGGAALSVGIARPVGAATVSLDHTLASSRFGANLAPEIGSNATSVTRLRIDGLAGGGKHPLSYGFGLDRMNGTTPTTLLRGRLSGGDGHTFFSNTMALRIGSGPLDASGLLQVRRPFGAALGRFDVGYGFGSETAFQIARASLEKNISSSYRVRLGLDFDATRAGEFGSFGTLYRMLGALAVGVNLSVDSRGTAKASLLLSVGMEGDDALHSVALARPGAADTGSVAVRVFLDKNFDNKFDEGDVPLPNIGLRVGGRPAIVKTSHNGTCYIERLASNQDVTLTLNDDTLDDPSWAPATPGVIVVPRSGRTMHLEFPVIEATEIEGRVQSDSGSRPGLIAELVNYAGKVAATSVPDEYGAYVFSRVRPGDYTLRLTDASGQECGFRTVRVPAGAMMKACDVKLGPPKKG